MAGATPTTAALFHLASLTGVKILVAPDKFAGTLSAVEAAAAIAEGWRRTAPHDAVMEVPLADGGPGFVDVLHASLGGDRLERTVSGPHGVRRER
jgi:glycerate kinase